MTAVQAARSLLFVPGDRPERFAKAAASHADVIVLDLEDAVSPANKPAALRNVIAWLGANGPAVVRVNGTGTRWHDAEIGALAPTSASVMLPKAEDTVAISRTQRRLGGARLIALVETAVGIRDVDAICAAPGVVRAALGTVDLGAELGVDPASHTAFAYARGRLVIASASAGLPSPIDGVTTVLHDPDLLARDLDEAGALGFGAKLCIHPSQVEIVNSHFRPTEQDVAWALRVTQAVGNDDGVLVIDGAMIDAPVIRRAERILRQSQLGGRLPKG